MKQLLFIAILLSSFAVNAASLSYTGNLDHDDDFRRFDFTVDSTSNVSIRTWSHAGGINAAGDVISDGGFDPLIVLFDNAGTWIGMNDDVDGQNGMYDSLLTWELTGGNYIVALAQFGHDLSQMPDLDDIQWLSGEVNFDGRTSSYALDINVSPVPVPAAVWLFGSALMSLLGMRKKSQIATV